MKRIQFIFEHNGKEILGYTESLHKALTRLRYEGKVSIGKNIKTASRVTKVLDQRARSHSNFQERILFPFLETHIPRYETRIHFLRSDHHEIKKYSQKLRNLLRSLSKKFGKDHHIDSGAIQETGVYLIGLLRHHIQLEEEGIHKALKKDLNRDELNAISKKIQKWVICHDGKKG